MALAGNPELRMARREIDAASARILRAGRIPNPELSIDWSEIPAGFDLARAATREIGIAQELEFPGKRAGRIRIAEIDRESAVLELERMRALVTAAVSESFYRALLAQKLVENLEAVLELLQRFAETAAIRYEAQKTSFLEVLRARVEIAKMKNQIVEARRAFRVECASLDRLLGRGGMRPIRLTGELTYIPFDRSRMAAADSLLDSRAVVRIAAARERRGQAAAALAGKSSLPDFSLGLAHQHLREQPPFDANGFSGTVANALALRLGVSLPLWFWQGPRGEAAEAEAQLRIAEEEREAVVRNARSAIDVAFAEVLAAEEQVRMFDESLLRDVQDELEAGINSYRNDRIDALNLLEIYRTYTQTRAEYLRALFAYNAALSRLTAAGEENVP